METKYTEKLAKLLFVVSCLTLAILALVYFGNVVGYIVSGFITALIAKPLMTLMRKVKIRGKTAPDGLFAVLSLVFLLLVIASVMSGILPLVRKLVENLSIIASGARIDSLSRHLAGLNATLIETFHLAPDFKIEVIALDRIASILDFNKFGSMIGTVASTFAGIGVGLFSAFFIAFFLIKDESIVPRFIAGLTPEKHSAHMDETVDQVRHLLSRYFLGLVIEMAIVGLIDFLGLWLVVRLDFESAIGIGFLAGLLNIIPYIGPLLGGVLGSVMGILLKICSTGAPIMNVNFLTLIMMFAAVFLVAQMVDNFVLQPVIYSKSIKAHPLEIFIVMLVGGSIGGMVGILLAIPAYTVIRVVAVNLFPEAKFVKTFLT